MKKVEIYDEDCSVVIEDKYDITDFTIYPDTKTLKVSRSIKDDCFYNTQIIEYKISSDLIELYIRTIESSSEPPLTYSIKDGVVLESGLTKADKLFPGRLESLKKEVRWSKVEILGNYEVNLYLLSKHPEIISREEYRRFLRQSIERIKIGVEKVENFINKNPQGLKIVSSEYGKYIDFIDNKTEEKDLEYVQKLNDSIFKEETSDYIGITRYEFNTYEEIIRYIENILNEQKKPPVTNKSTQKTDSGSIMDWVYLIFVILIVLYFWLF